MSAMERFNQALAESVREGTESAAGAREARREARRKEKEREKERDRPKDRSKDKSKKRGKDVVKGKGKGSGSGSTGNDYSDDDRDKGRGRRRDRDRDRDRDGDGSARALPRLAGERDRVGSADGYSVSSSEAPGAPNTGELECLVCLESFMTEGEKTPRLLACGHTICEACLRMLRLDDKGQVRCPTCRSPTALGGAGVHGCPKNFALIHAMGMMSPAAAGKRGGRDKDRERGAAGSDSGGGGRGGPRTSELDYGAGGAPPVPASHLCQFHGKPVGYYCLDDQVLVCGDCLYERGRHEHHRCPPVDSAARAARTDVDEFAREVHRSGAMLNAAANKVKGVIRGVEETAAEARDSINREFDAIIEAARARRAQLLREVDSVAAGKLDALHEQVGMIDFVCRKVGQVCGDTSEALRSNDLAMLSRFAELNANLAETAAASKSCELEPCTSARVTCFIDGRGDEKVMEIGRVGVFSTPRFTDFTTSWEEVRLMWIEGEPLSLPITKYEIEMASKPPAAAADDPFSEYKTVYDGVGEMALIKDLTPGALHHFRIRGVNVVGPSEWMSEATIKTKMSSAGKWDELRCSLLLSIMNNGATVRLDGGQHKRVQAVNAAAAAFLSNLANRGAAAGAGDDDDDEVGRLADAEGVWQACVGTSDMSRGRHYLEIEINDAGMSQGCHIMIGVTRFPIEVSGGCFKTKDAYMYYCHDGTYHNGMASPGAGQRAAVGSRIGMLLDFEGNMGRGAVLSFFKDGRWLGNAFTDLHGTFHPVVDLLHTGAQVTLVHAEMPAPGM